MKKLFLFLFLFPAVFVSAQIQKNNKSALTIEKIMQEPANWIGTSPENISWNEQSNIIYFDWNPEKDTLSSLFSYSLKTGKIAKTPLEEKRKLAGRNSAYNSAKSKKVYVSTGNLFLFDIEKNTTQQLTDWLERISSPKFVRHDTEISFLKDNNLFCINPETGLIRQITNFVSGDEKPESKTKGQDLFLENQQKDLFNVLKGRDAKEKARKYKEELEEEKELLKIYLGKKRLRNAELSPSGKYVVYNTFLNAQGGKQTSVTHFVTESGYTEEKDGRTKVGSPQSETEMGIFDIENNKLIKIKTDEIPGLKDLPEYLKNYPERMPKDSSEIKNRAINIMGPVWNETQDLAVIVALSHDNKDRWILLLDPATGKTETLDRQHDEAWIGGPGIGGWGMSTGDLGWMPDGKSVWFHSEVSGYSHLYAVNIGTKKKTALTSGEFEVSDAFISKDKKHFYFTAN
ncbi:MAG TPA: DPP IV N-terminal domain-containing protein, partial [Draconibacterium sp.]|nr:DPP IV N-terminal domain-containing protein [Draconibacterium sp.]